MPSSSRRRLGVVFSHMRLSEGMQLSRSERCRFHAIGIKLSWRTPESEAIRIASHFRNQIAEAGTKLVYFDGDDDVCIQWPEVLRIVDLYVKKGVFSSDDDYMRSFAGKSNLTDYVSKTYGVPVPTDITKSGVLEPADLGKLHLGWSTALDDKHIGLFREMKLPTAARKDVDILCRASLPNDWKRAPSEHRRPQAGAIARPTSSHRFGADEPSPSGTVLRRIAP